MILAGDLGGTKCTLILYDVDGQQLRAVYRLTARTAEFPNIEDFFANFREQAKREGHPLVGLASAGFGVAGAIVNDEVVCNNLPWTITRQRVAERRKIGPSKTMLLNDGDAAASSLAHQEKKDLLELNPGIQFQQVFFFEMRQARCCSFHIIEEQSFARLDLQAFRDSKKK